MLLSASGAGIRPLATSKNFLALKEKAKRGVGEVAKKLKENFGVALNLDK